MRYTRHREPALELEGRMAAGRYKGRKFVIASIATLLATKVASSNVAFPFNSQVPTVARVDEQYSFQLSPSTFAPDDANLTYSLSSQPPWLRIDSTSRTLSGTPSQSDIGSAHFTITAASMYGGVTHMECTLVVSKDPAPQLKGDISEQLAMVTNLSSSHPPVLTVLPSTQFHFQFNQGSFIDIVERKLYYYATLADHTPLPAWLQFDSQRLVFSGMTPQLTTSPQSWVIELIASDVVGFGAASTSFTIATSADQLIFVPEYQTLNFSAGEPLKFDGLGDTLFRDGVKLDPAELESANASVPPWLKFDSKTLTLSGVPPGQVQNENVSVTVYDRLGNRATAVIRLATDDASTLFTGNVGTLTAYAGKYFSFEFPESLFAIPDADVQVILPTTATWLQFDTATRRLTGKVPNQTHTYSFEGKIRARSSSMSSAQTQAFTIKVMAAGPGSASSDTTSTSSPSSRPPRAFNKDSARSHLNSGVVAAVVLGCLLAAAILAACLVLLRRRKKNRSYVEPMSPNRRTISRPILQQDHDAITVTTELQRDIEKTADVEATARNQDEVNNAPQLSLSLPLDTQNKRMKWTKRFSRISQNSSLGVGEDAIRADSNIPEWGRQSSALHNPHESFSVPAEIARRSSKKTSEPSPTKRALKRISKRRAKSTQSIGLGINTGDSVIAPQRSLPDRSHHRAVSSVGLTGTTDRASLNSTSTRGTSVLSTRPSDFPRPPTRSTLGGIRKVPKASLTDVAKRMSIRVVDRSDSIADDRSMHERRRSFIRNRASTSLVSPLFANGARVSTYGRPNGRASVNGSSLLAHQPSQRGVSQLTTYSESSSLEPPPQDPRRLSARLRSAFAPNFPRAVTNTTLGADTSSFYTTSSSVSERDYIAEMALPRHERSFVLPGEASPSPSPASSVVRRRRARANTRKITPLSKRMQPRQKCEERLCEASSPPLAKGLAMPLAERRSLSASARISQMRRSRLTEPMSLVSNDSLNRSKPERPRLVETSSRRPVSIEKAQRLSSLKAEAEDARPGSEMFEALEGAGLMPPSVAEGKEASQKSNTSGPVFL